MKIREHIDQPMKEYIEPIAYNIRMREEAAVMLTASQGQEGGPDGVGGIVTDGSGGSGGEGTDYTRGQSAIWDTWKE